MRASDWHILATWLNDQIIRHCTYLHCTYRDGRWVNSTSWLSQSTNTWRDVIVTHAAQNVRFVSQCSYKWDAAQINASCNLSMLLNSVARTWDVGYRLDNSTLPLPSRPFFPSPGPPFTPTASNAPLSRPQIYLAERCTPNGSEQSQTGKWFLAHMAAPGDTHSKCRRRSL